MLYFEWDEKKNRTNRKKHGIWFEEAQQVFDDPHGLLFFDDAHSKGDEERFILLGKSGTNRVLVVIHCEQEGNAVRIVSARKATSKERETYEKGI